MDRRAPSFMKLLGAMLVALLLAAGCSGDEASPGGTDIAVDASPRGTATQSGEVGADDLEAGDDDDQPEEAEIDLPPLSDVGDDTLVWVHGVEPLDLHYHDPRNLLPTTSWIREAMLESLFGVSADLGYYQELLADEPTLTADDDGTILIEFTLRDGLQWSDGMPLTTADIQYTHQIMTEGCPTEPDGSIVDGVSDGCVYLMADRSGLDLVTNFDVEDEQEFSITMAGFYPDWRSLYSPVYAAHAFGVDAAAVNRNLRSMATASGPLPASGPMIMARWDRGVGMVLTRNDGYHGSVSPDATNAGPASVDSIRIDFVPSLNDRIDAVQAGAAHVMMESPSAELARLAGSDDFEVGSTPGDTFEHWGFNLLNPHLAKPGVRLAIAHAIDKESLVETVYGPIYGAALPAAGLGNSYWVPAQRAYQNNQEEFDGRNLDEAAEALTGEGYVLGSDGIYRHPVDGRLTLRAGTTGGNQLREEEQAVLQAQLAEAGIDITIDNLPGGTYFSERPFSPDALAASASAGEEGDATIWDITQFARSGGAWPGGQSGAYRSGSGGNPYGFANAEFDVKASECDAVIDDDERAQCYNELDRFVTTLAQGSDGLVVIPLTQRPTFFGHVPTKLAAVGVAPDSIAGGPLVNVVDYQRR